MDSVLLESDNFYAEVSASHSCNRFSYNVMYYYFAAIRISVKGLGQAPKSTHQDVGILFLMSRPHNNL